MNIFYSIRTANQAATAKFRKRAKVTPGQYLVLKALSEAGAINQTTLGELTGIDRASITALVRRLQAGNLIAVTKDRQDRRAHTIQLRPSGRRLVEKLSPIAQEVEAELMANVGPRNQKVLVNALSLISEAA